MLLKTCDLIDILLKDPDWKERKKAARDLGKDKSESAKKALQAATADDDEDVSFAAILSLIKLNSCMLLEEVIKPKILLSDNESIRWAAAYALGKLGNTTHIKYLCELINDQDWSVRNEAYSALEKLISLIQAGNSNGSRLSENFKLLILMLRLDHHILHTKIIETLVRFKAYTLEMLIESLNTSNESIKVGVVKALGEIGSLSSVQHLVQQIHDSSAAVRKEVVKALGKIGGYAAINTVVERFGDGNREVVETAISSIISRNNDGTVILVLIENLRSVYNVAIKKNILYCMGEIKHPSMIMPILDNLGSSYFFVRTAASSAIAKFGEVIRNEINGIMAVNNISIGSLLEEAANCENPELRIRAIRALGQLKHPQAYETLKKLSQDNDNKIAGAAENSLAQLNDATWARANGAYVLGKIGGKQSLPFLLEALHDSCTEVRASAISALRKIKDPETSESIAMLAVSDDDADVRNRAVWAVGDIGHFSPQIKGFLIKTVSDESHLVRSEAVRVLGKIPDDTVIDVLLDVLKDKSFNVRKNAFNALYTIGEDCIPKLLNNLHMTDDKYIRLGTLNLLGALDAKQSIPDIQKLLETEKDQDIIKKAKFMIRILTIENIDKDLLFLSDV